MARANASLPSPIEEAESRAAKSYVRLKRPNQKQYNNELADICDNIRKLREELKVVDSKERAEADECRKIRLTKSVEFDKKRELEAQLKVANQEAVNKSDSLAKLQINLHYKSEARIDEAVRRLESLLCSSTLKQSEEKKLTLEIESLKRSKVILMEYNQQKQELEDLKQQVKMTRLAREEVFQTLSALKAKEDQHARERTESKNRGASIQSELEALFEMKRKLKDDFAAQKRAYNVQRAEAEQRTQDKARMEAEHRKKSQIRMEFIRKYQDVEHQHCSMLLQYLQRLDGGVMHGAAALERNAPSAKDTEDSESCTVSTSKRHGKKKHKQRLDRPLRHTPEAVSWFLELGLVAPATAADIGPVTEKLHALKVRHEQVNTDVSPPFLTHEVQPDTEQSQHATCSADTAKSCMTQLCTRESECRHQPVGNGSDSSVQAAVLSTSSCYSCRHRQELAHDGSRSEPVAADTLCCMNCCVDVDETATPTVAAGASQYCDDISRDVNASHADSSDSTFDVAVVLQNYDAKGFIHKTLTLASGGRDDAMTMS